MAKLKTFQERLKTGDFPNPAPWKSEAEVVEAYDSGFPGAFYDPEGTEEIESGRYGRGEDAVRTFGLEDAGKGKLSLLYPAIWKASGSTKIFQGNKSQPVGDCVSRGQTHAAMLSLAAAVLNGKGSWPKFQPGTDAETMGFHPHGVYWLRGHGGHGWSCASAAKESKSIGLIEFQQYPGPLSYDMTRYTTATSTRYGSTRPPREVIEQLSGHRTLDYSVPKTFEQVRDLIASGYAVDSCGSEGFSKSRDANGVSGRSGSWSHSMAYCAVDDTEWAHKNYGEPLVCVLNSWGENWIKGSRSVHGGSDYPEIPKGAFWAKWSQISRRSCFAITAVDGYPPMKLPDWKIGDII